MRLKDLHKLIDNLDDEIFTLSTFVDTKYYWNVRYKHMRTGIFKLRKIALKNKVPFNVIAKAIHVNPSRMTQIFKGHKVDWITVSSHYRGISRAVFKD